jgi:hypothetical protein
MQKKPWEKPELIVFSRNKSDENVLTNCKGAVSTGSSTFFGGCASIPGCGIPCFIAPGS